MRVSIVCKLSDHYWVSERLIAMSGRHRKSQNPEKFSYCPSLSFTIVWKTHNRGMFSPELELRSDILNYIIGKFVVNFVLVILINSHAQAYWSHQLSSSSPVFPASDRIYFGFASVWWIYHLYLIWVLWRCFFTFHKKIWIELAFSISPKQDSRIWKHISTRVKVVEETRWNQLPRVWHVDWGSSWGGDSRLS